MDQNTIIALATIFCLFALAAGIIYGVFMD